MQLVLLLDGIPFVTIDLQLIWYLGFLVVGTFAEFESEAIFSLSFSHFPPNASHCLMYATYWGVFAAKIVAFEAVFSFGA